MRAIYPGSFDPVTFGHLDIIERASLLFDSVIVAVSRNPLKNPLFSTEERVEMLREVLALYPNVEVDSFEGLTVDYALQKKAKHIVRGLRVISDFENEFRMALTNKKLTGVVETIFLMTKAEYSCISSSTVKELASFGGSLSCFVPPLVEERLIEKNKNRSFKLEKIQEMCAV
ncbi:pantetheine-phosphate adenylyltransferase [Pelotomaculum propionicicum]|uniref:Phosphopantetheine adenylyltransferase n=1 Tax=Pelotomaculum propionicicum TaxID=258475 RepID=A0A4Y7RSV7_9FIRM|nr:pantetheine-phosphate adenylyltransferase [Pelotomaculum propionicicum]TEB12104.1 Phosphopantetheine adenylyltransferase [Pelotomaculum propionicicum]